MMTSGLMLVCLCALCQSDAPAAAPATVEDLSAAVEAYVTSLRDFSVELEVQGTFIPGPSDTGGQLEKIETREVIEILSPQAEGTRPWRRWTRRDRETDQLLKYYAFDGTEATLFESRSAQRPQDYHTGRIFSQDSISINATNYFDIQTFANLKGLAEIHDPGWKLSPQIRIKWSDPEEVEYLGRKAFRLVGNNPQLQVTQEVTVLAPPHALVVRRIFHDGNADAELGRWEVTELQTHGQRTYPAAGTYHQRPQEHQGLHLYDFKVITINDLSGDEAQRQKLRDTWSQIDWPGNTLVHDEREGTRRVIPKSEEEQRQETREKLQKLSAEPPSE